MCRIVLFMSLLLSWSVYTYLLVFHQHVLHLRFLKYCYISWILLSPRWIARIVLISVYLSSAHRPFFFSSLFSNEFGIFIKIVQINYRFLRVINLTELSIIITSFCFTSWWNSSCLAPFFRNIIKSITYVCGFIWD